MSRVVFGVRPVEELCRARPRDVVIVYVAEGYRSKEIEMAVAVAKDRGIAVEIRPRALVAGLAGAPHHQGMVAIAGEFQYVRLDEMLAARCGRRRACSSVDSRLHHRSAEFRRAGSQR